MFREQTTRFLYKAHAVGASGTFTKPHAETLEAQASCSLSIDGGKASARVDAFHFHDMIKIRSVYTQAVGTGDRENGPWNTLVTATIEGLNIHHVLTADRVVARLASKHAKDGLEAEVLVLGSHFENLKVAGRPVEMTPNSDFLSNSKTFSQAGKCCKPYAQSKDGRTIYTSIFSDVKCDGLKPLGGHSLLFPEFGTIHLGEIIVSEGERRLTMMRIEFGCAMEGNGNFIEVGGNGHEYP